MKPVVKVLIVQRIQRIQFVDTQQPTISCCLLFSWRYNPLWLYFHSPVAGFSLLVFKVSRSHTTTRYSR
jgi:hypothetical protein